MPRPSTITHHPRYADIERDLRRGVPAVELSATYNVSPSAISRHKKLRMSAFTQALADDTPAPDDVLSRIADLADSATKSRKLADGSNSLQIRARAQQTELSALSVLLDRLGVDDLTTVRLSSAAGYLIRLLQTFVMEHPEVAPEIVTRLRAIETGNDDLQEGFADLANTLQQLAKANTNA